MADFESSNMNDYTNFEDFFARRLKPGSRPLFKHSDASAAVVVADSRVVAFRIVAATKVL
ncbi:Phosphatidylserine decarboxylase proenzyme [Beauveria bassiana]|nr:Phosphatidylserine decarboxylase proenzyme [Beauveria bassiana]